MPPSRRRGDAETRWRVASGEDRAAHPPTRGTVEGTGPLSRYVEDRAGQCVATGNVRRPAYAPTVGLHRNHLVTVEQVQ